MPDNILYSTEGSVLKEIMDEYSHKGRAPMEFREGSRTVDPALQQTLPGRYDFPEGSPARQLGIQPVDVSAAGRRVPAPWPTPARGR